MNTRIGDCLNITYHDIFGYIAGAVMIIGMFPYVHSIVVTKETKLNRASWAIWSSIGIINLTAYFFAGEKETIWYVIAAAVNPTILFFLSLRFGEKQWYRSDTVCLVLAAMALVIWRLTGSPVLALIAGLVADALGIVPTFLKVRRDPFSENLLGWLALFTASVCNVIAIKEWTWANGVYNVHAVSGSFLVVWFIVKGQFFSKTASR